MDNAAFERDVLLTFLIGLRDELQRKLMQSEGSSLDDFLQEAISLEGRDLYIGKNQKFFQNQNSKWRNFTKAKLAFILNLVSITDRG